MYVSPKWICPHCGFINTSVFDLSENEFDQEYPVYCDVESGGCDNRLFIRLVIEPSVVVYKLEKVES